MMKDYIRKVNYYETDKMGVTHHSNYIRWMEEARVDFLEQIGCSYERMEADGIISPVIGLECQYKRTTTFGDEIRVRVGVEEFRGVRLVIRYVMTDNRTGETVFTGKSVHCFTTPNGKPIILKKQYPEADRILRDLASAE